MYAGKVVNEWDQRYIATLTNMVLHTKGSSIDIMGQTKIPLPPINVEPEDYIKWFTEKTSSDSSINTVAALSLHSSVQREVRQSRYVG